MADYTSRASIAQSKYEGDAMIAVHTANQCGSPHQENAAGVGDHPDIDQETVEKELERISYWSDIKSAILNNFDFENKRTLVE